MCETPPATAGELYSNLSNYSLATLYVPKGTLSAYQSADIWKKFKYIKEHELTAIDNIQGESPTLEFAEDGITIKDADEKNIYIYNTAGALVEKINNYRGEKIILEKGTYIISVDRQTIKAKL